MPVLSQNQRVSTAGLVSAMTCEKGKLGPHHRICGSPYRPDGSDELVVDCACRACGDIQTVPAFGQLAALSHSSSRVNPSTERAGAERPPLEVPLGKQDRKETTSMRAKRGPLHQRYLEIEARKAEILAIWEKSGHHLSAAAKEARVSNSTLLGKFKQWGVKTRRQEARVTLIDRKTQPVIKAASVNWPANIPELLIYILQAMPAPGSSVSVVTRWKQAFDAIFKLLYEEDTKLQ